MNSYWIAQKNSQITKSLKICYLFNISRIHLKTVHRRTEMIHQQRVSRSG